MLSLPKSLRVTSRGFSLLEVLVAFSIMSLALGILYRSMGASVHASVRAEQQVRAVQVAKSVLELHSDVSSQGVQSSGQSPDGIFWSVASSPFDGVPSDFSGGRRLHRLTVNVSWTESRNQQLLSFATLVPESAQ
jgi:general secretion pathway protein I